MMRNIKSTEERKGLTEISYYNIFKNLSEMVIIFDKKGKILDLNAFAINKLGYDPKEIESLSIQDLVDKDYRASLEKSVKKLDLLKSMTTKLVYITKDKSILPVEVKLWKSSDYAGQFNVCIAREDNKTQTSIGYKTLYKKMESVLDHFPGPIFLKDTKNNLLLVNKFMAEAHNRKKDEMIGLNCFEIYPKDLAKAYWEDDLGVINSRKPKLFIEEPWQHRGSKEWVSTSKIPFINKEGKIEGVLGFSFDITGIKRAELEYKERLDYEKSLKDKFKVELEEKVKERTNKLNKALKQQKLYLDQIVKASRFKTEFLATMSHELRTPLNAIIGFTDLLLEEVYGPLNDDQLEFINDIKTSAQYQHDMVARILDISKIESGQLKLEIKEFSLNNIVDQVKATLKPIANKKELKILIKGLEKEKKITADPIRIKEILINLIGNAIKFTPEGSVKLIIKDKLDHWIFSIRDTGIGIAREDFGKIFKEFERIDSTYVKSVAGTGLGLPLTKRLVNLHGGEITFSSVLGVGSEFVFTIPKELDNSKLTEFLKLL